jgi:hypothetical protein
MTMLRTTRMRTRGMSAAGKYPGLLGVLLALSALACGDGTAPDPPSIMPEELEIVSGNHPSQRW